MKKTELKEELNNVISSLIGHDIGIKHIHTDEYGSWENGIPQKSLKEMHPLTLVHYRKSIFVVFPAVDMKKLMNGEISVQEYVENATWSFGYYWAGDSMFSATHWQPIEEKGIHDTKKIKRYLQILICRTKTENHIPLNYGVCFNCFVKHCPFIPKEETYCPDEVEEYDNVPRFFNAVKQKVNELFGFKVVQFKCRSENTICITPSHCRDTVIVYLPQDLLLNMMYYPNNTYPIEEALNMDIQISFHPYYKDGKLLPWEYCNGSLDKKKCYDFWKKKAPHLVKDWF